MKHLKRIAAGVVMLAALAAFVTPMMLPVIFPSHWWAWVPLALGALYLLGCMWDDSQEEYWGC